MLNTVSSQLNSNLLRPRAPIPLPSNLRIPNLSTEKIPIEVSSKPISELITYILEDEDVDSFAKVEERKDVQNFHYTNSKLIEYKHTPIMASIFFGPTLQRVNSKPLGRKMIKVAQILSEGLRPLLVEGWILVKLEPVSLVHVESKQRRTIFSYNFRDINLSQQNSSTPPSSPSEKKSIPDVPKLPQSVHRRTRSRTSSFKQISPQIQLDIPKKEEAVSLKSARSRSSQDLLQDAIPKPLSYHDFNESFASKRVTYEEFLKIKGLN